MVLTSLLLPRTVFEIERFDWLKMGYFKNQPRLPNHMLNYPVQSILQLMRLKKPVAKHSHWSSMSEKKNKLLELLQLLLNNLVELIF